MYGELHSCSISSSLIIAFRSCGFISRCINYQIEYDGKFYNITFSIRIANIFQTSIGCLTPNLGTAVPNLSCHSIMFIGIFLFLICSHRSHNINKKPILGKKFICLRFRISSTTSQKYRPEIYLYHS